MGEELTMAEMTAEDTIKLLQAKAASAGDSFRIKVFRLSALRPTENTQVALLSDAVLAHATNPELWMPQLCGGGVFAFFVYHLTDPNQYVGGPIRFNVEGEPRAVNPEIVYRADWQGPKKLDFPPRVVNNGPSFSVASTGNPTGTAPQTQVSSGQTVAPHLVSDPNVARTLADLQRELDALRAKGAALDAERHKLDIERIRQENDMRLQQLENRLTAQRPAPVEHKTDVGATLAAVATALTPLVQTIITGQNDLRREMMKIEQERANQTNMLLTKIMDRPERPLIDPMIEKILDKATTPTNQPEAIASMTAAMGSMAEVSMGMIQQVAEMQSGGQEHWGLQAAREVAKGIGALAGGMKVKQPGQQQKQVGPGGPPQARAGFAQPPIPQQPPPQQRGNGAVATQQHQPPAPTAPVKSAPVNVQGPDGVWREVPADQVNVPASQQTVNAQPVTSPAQPVTVTQYAAQAQQEPVPVQHFEKPVAQPQQQVLSVIDSIKVSITQYMDVRQLAGAIIDSLPDPEFQRELDSVDQSFSALAAKHLSEWVHLDPRNPGYLKELFDEVERQGVARGVFDTGEGDDVSDQDTSDEDESDQNTSSDNAG